MKAMKKLKATRIAGAGRGKERCVLVTREFPKKSKPNPTMSYPFTPMTKHGTRLKDRAGKPTSR